MKIGYPCINNSFDCRPSRTFRLDSYSQEYLIEKVEGNLDCLKKILHWNTKHDLLFFRITSDLIPFASHEVNDFDWQSHFSTQFKELGEIISRQNIRISMHPGQYTVLNSPDQGVVQRAVSDLVYHADVLDLLGLDETAKIQVHVGGVYGDKMTAMDRFVHNYEELPGRVKSRLVIENDDTSYSLADCMMIHEAIKIPIIFDNLHHFWCNNGESVRKAITQAANTWSKGDGAPMIDYSDQAPGERDGRHREHVDSDHFKEFLEDIPSTVDPDIMLEIKDKEVSAEEALEVMRGYN